jgi:LPXTG-motif cell wall-anchored protein
MPPVESPNGTPWIPLPSGHPIPVRKGYAYYVLISVKTSHPTSEIKSEMLTALELISYKEAPASGDYRTVTVLARAKKDDDDIPWKAPGVAFWDKTTAIKGWYSPPAGSKKPLPDTEEPDDTGMIVAGVLGVGAAGGLGWWWWRRRKRKLAAGGST